MLNLHRDALRVVAGGKTRTRISRFELRLQIRMSMLRRLSAIAREHGTLVADYARIHFATRYNLLKRVLLTYLKFLF